MATVEVRGLSKAYGAVSVLKDVDLSIGDGEFVVFVGRSGCGKSTLLRCIAGLEALTDGAILIDGVDVTRRAPAKRQIAMVFQSYALYPHLTVRDNLGFSLKLAKRPKEEAREQVEKAAKTLQISDLLDRKPAQLSGGQRQRVAMGRAIVRDPTAFLFDEPLSNLDADLRVQMRREIMDLHRDLGATMIYVTHDQVEAMTMADKIVVLNDGRVEQIGTPLDLYRNPRNAFVATFLGSPRMNILPLNAAESSQNLQSRQWLADLTQFGERPENIGIRPEHITVAPETDGSFCGTITAMEHLGSERFLFVQINGFDQPVVARDDGLTAYDHGDQVGLRFNREHVHRFDNKGNALMSAH